MVTPSVNAASPKSNGAHLPSSGAEPVVDRHRDRTYRPQKRKPGSVETPSDREPSALVRAMEAAAVDEAVDAVKFDRLMSAQERMAAKEARSQFDCAFAAMQAELPVITEKGVLTTSLGQPTSTYPLWEDINEAIKPVLSNFGFGLRFRISQDHTWVVITAILSHASGHSEETTMRLPVDLSGGKNPVQAIGSSTSYGKRYTASALLNLTSRGEDDDGKAAARTTRISPEEVAELRTLISASKADEARLVAYLEVARLEDLPPARLERARSAIRAKGGQS